MNHPNNPNKPGKPNKAEQNPKAERSAISPRRSENYPEWYQQVIKGADLAEASPVRGCMVIKPWGYAIWESIQAVLDRMFKDTGHVNAYFPLLIPKSFLEKEAEHVEGFAKECAVVTHHRLEVGPDGKSLVPAGELDEPLIIRPTSETIIGASYAKWVQSYRDLPILINQWANVMRWEMRTRMFLRTSEFLWQEGHTVHATAKEAMEETRKMLDVYHAFANDYMAMPVIRGEKTPGERFPGAVNTFTIEAMMQDRKALQAGTSHFLGQNFAKASGIKFLNAESKEEIAWTTSWGVSTRLIGGLIMTHSDDDGLVLPPRLASKHVVINPIFRNDDERASVMEYCDRLRRDLNDLQFGGLDFISGHGTTRLQVWLDDRDLRGGDKTWQHIKKGIPVRLEIGPRDIQNDSVFMGRRDQSPRDKKSVGRSELLATIIATLNEMQNNLHGRALEHQKANTKHVDTWADFEAFFGKARSDDKDDDDTSSTQGGFALAHWSDDPSDTAAIDAKLKPLKVTARCIPLDPNELGTGGHGKCLFTGKPSKQRVIFAKAY